RPDLVALKGTVDWPSRKEPEVKVQSPPICNCALLATREPLERIASPIVETKVDPDSVTVAPEMVNPVPELRIERPGIRMLNRRMEMEGFTKRYGANPITR